MHQAHESGWGIAKAERQYYGLVMTIMISKSGFANIFILYSDLVVARP